MKQKYNKMGSAALALLLLTATGCTDQLTGMEEAPEQKPEAGKLITVTATQEGRGVQTRVNYEEQKDGTVNVTWAAGDKFYAGKVDAINSGDVAAPSSVWQTFSLTGDPGMATGTFEGIAADGWHEGDPIYAITNGSGFGNLFLQKQGEETFLGCHYGNQQQKTNGSDAHLAGCDLMYTSTTYSINSTPNFKFKHLNALMKFTLTLPESDKTVDRLTLYSKNNEKLFIKNMNLFLANETKIAVEVSSQAALTLSGENGSGGLRLTGTELTAYMMMGPTKDMQTYDNKGNQIALPTLQGKEILLTVRTTDGDAYVAELTGSPIEAGQFYTVEATLKNATGFFDKGTGTSEDPIQIKDAGQLRTLATLVNGSFSAAGKFFKLTATNIDLEGEEWIPIGINDPYFRGTFDGNGCTIKELKIDNEASYQGLFALLNGATVKNLKVQGSINGGNIVGGIAGSASSAYIYGCSFDGAISGKSSVGGISGTAFSSYIIGCSKTGSTTATELPMNYIGGISGNMSRGYAVGCYNTGDVTVATGEDESGIGGISGKSGSAYGCYNTGSVTWTGDKEPTGIGGLMGYGDTYYLEGYAYNSLWTKGSAAANAATNGLGAGCQGEQIDASSSSLNNEENIATLNRGITKWNALLDGGNNDASSPKYCNFHYEASTDGSNVPVLVAKAPDTN